MIKAQKKVVQKNPQTENQIISSLILLSDMRGRVTGFRPQASTTSPAFTPQSSAFPKKKTYFLEAIGCHRITECSGLEGTSVGRLFQHPCRSRVTYSRLHRTLSRRVLNISREGDFTTSLGSLFQCSITLRVKKFFLFLSATGSFLYT